MVGLGDIIQGKGRIIRRRDGVDRVNEYDDDDAHA